MATTKNSTIFASLTWVVNILWVIKIDLIHDLSCLYFSFVRRSVLILDKSPGKFLFSNNSISLAIDKVKASDDRILIINLNNKIDNKNQNS